MDGANLDSLSGMVIGNGPMSMPQVTTNALAVGPSTAMQTVLTQLSPPVPTSQNVPPVILGGNGPFFTLSHLPYLGAATYPQLCHK